MIKYNNGPKMQRIVRKFTGDVKNNLAAYIKEYDSNRKFAGSEFGAKQETDISDRYNNNLLRIRKDAIAQLQPIFEEARTGAIKHITAAPTADMVHALAILDQLHMVTPETLHLFAPTMANCPLAQLRLSEIAMKHNIVMGTPDPQLLLHSVEVCQEKVNDFINQYDALDEKIIPHIQQMYEYFRPDNELMNTDLQNSENALKAFWDEQIRVGSPAYLDTNNDGTASYTYQYYFTDAKGLIDYLEAKTAGMTKEGKEAFIESVMDNSPHEYYAAWGWYEATGQISDSDINLPIV